MVNLQHVDRIICGLELVISTRYYVHYFLFERICRYNAFSDPHEIDISKQHSTY
jgi:hypothetical protein